MPDIISVAEINSTDDGMPAFASLHLIYVYFIY